ncbi:MAG: TrmJ/YjtD family RNA methyltransferase [Gemmatimonadaceae bacterium]
MSESLLSAVTVVLYEPQDPINIGAVVRAMKNMGVSDLRLVRPCKYDVTRIEQIAHDTRELAESIRHFDDLESAIADCVRVVAYSARRRAAKVERLTPRTCAAELIELAPTGRVAIMFGREDHGLPNEAIDRAHAVASIPTTDHKSLNLAQACLLALYEIHLAAGDATVKQKAPRHATAQPTVEELEKTFSDANAALRAIAFYRTRNPELIMRSLRSLVFRAKPDVRELMLLRAASIEVLRTIERENKRAVAEALAALPGAPSSSESQS